MRRQTTVAKSYNSSCVEHRAKVNSELYNHLCGFRNVEDLVDLDLSKNYLGNEAGFDCILDLLKKTHSLKTLNLSYSGLTTQNITDLAAVLLNHPTLKELTLSYNRLYIDSGVQLVRLARFNPRLLIIDIVDQPGNDVDRQMANHIPPNIVSQMQRHLRFNSAELSKKSAAAAAAGGQHTASAMLRQRLAAQDEDPQ